MTTEDHAEPPKLLSVPPAGPAHYARNLIRTAVCELRFPTLFELDADRPPSSLAKALRKDFPSYERVKNMSVGPGGISHANAHAFRSKRGTWTVSLGTSAISLETNAYDSFGDFLPRLKKVVAAAAEVIDSDFFTRVGLRYINEVPFGPDELAEWVNPALVGPLAEGVYGTVGEHWQRVVGPTKSGGYIFQHGLAKKLDGKRNYVLDFDFFGEDVVVADTITLVEDLHALEFSMFSWAIGQRAREHLGASTL